MGPRCLATLARATGSHDLETQINSRVAKLGLIAVAARSGYSKDQVELILEIRRLLEARLAAERAQTEQERLSMLGMVSASLAHELKNPLSSMKALAQTVREELERDDADSEQAKDLGLIVEQVDPTHDLSQTIEHAIVGAGNRQPPPVVCPVVAVWHGPVSLRPHSLTPKSRRRVDRNQLIKDAGDPVVKGDIDQLAAPGGLPGPDSQ